MKEEKTNKGQGNFWVITSVILLGIIALNVSDDFAYVMNEFVNVESYQLKQLHDGKNYFYKNYTVLSNLDENVTFVFRNENKFAHFLWEVSNEDVTTYELYENCTITDNGTKIISRNRNRYYDNGATLKIYKDPSFTCENCKILYNARYSSKRFNLGVVREHKEIVFKKNTDYCFIIKDRVNAEDTVNYLFDWYEEEDE